MCFFFLFQQHINEMISWETWRHAGSLCVCRALGGQPMSPGCFPVKCITGNKMDSCVRDQWVGWVNGQCSAATDEWVTREWVEIHCFLSVHICYRKECVNHQCLGFFTKLLYYLSHTHLQGEWKVSTHLNKCSHRGAFNPVSPPTGQIPSGWSVLLRVC